MQTESYKYICTCMHVRTHICIITYTCSCGFPAKLPPCVVRYPWAPSREAETHLWGQGIPKPISPRPGIQKAAPCMGPCVHFELQHGLSMEKLNSTKPHSTNEDVLRGAGQDHGSLSLDLPSCAMSWELAPLQSP